VPKPPTRFPIARKNDHMASGDDERLRATYERRTTVPTAQSALRLTAISPSILGRADEVVE
jgi:hypothetical protein